MEGAFHVVLGRTMKDKSVVSDLNSGGFFMAEVHGNRKHMVSNNINMLQNVRGKFGERRG